jgi:predicted Zn-dependent protease
LFPKFVPLSIKTTPKTAINRNNRKHRINLTPTYTMNIKLLILTALILVFGTSAEAKMKIIKAPEQRRPISEWRRTQQIHYFNEGKRQQLFGSGDRAFTCFKFALWADPYCDACYYEMSSLYITQQNYKQAAIAAKNAYLLDTTNYWYTQHCAKLLFVTGDTEAADKLYWKCLAQKPKNPELYEELLDLYAAQKYFDKQENLLDFYEQYFGQDAMALSARQQLYYKQGKLDKSAQQAVLLAEKFPGTQRYCLLAAELYLQQDSNALAEEYFLRAGQIDSTNLEYQISLADYYRRTECFSEYFTLLQQIFANPQANLQTKLYILEFLQKFPAFTNVYAEEMAGLYNNMQGDTTKSCVADWLFAQFLMQNRLWGQAKTVMQLSLQRVAEEPPATKPEMQAVDKIAITLFSIMAEQQQWDSIIAVSDRYVNSLLFKYIAGKYYACYFKAFALLQKKQYDAAKTVAQSAVQYIEPADTVAFSQIYAMLGDICFELKEHSQCDKFYQKALSYTPHNVLLLNNYAYYLSLRGKKLRKALIMSAYTIEQEPNNVTYLDTYAWILYKQKRYEEAKAVFRKAIMYNGDKEFAVLEHYGDVLFEMGEKTNAIIYWKRSIDSGNKDPALLQKINNN